MNITSHKIKPFEIPYKHIIYLLNPLNANESTPYS